MGRRIAIALACVCALFISTCVTFAGPASYTVYVAGKAMTVSVNGSSAAYYVNGANGTAGEVYNTEPTEWHGKLSYDAGEAALVFEMNGLDVAEKGIWSDHGIKIIIRGDNSIKGTVETGGSQVQGIYVKGGLKISDESDGTLRVESEDMKGSCFGIYSAGDFEMNGGVLELRAGDVIRKFGASGVSTGLYSEGDITINEGEISGHGGRSSSNWADQSRGIYSKGQVVVNDGVVNAYGGTATGDFSYGLGAYDGIDISGGEVNSYGGPAPFSVGLYSDWDLTIGGDAVVKAESSDEGVRAYSYGTYVFRNLLVKDNAYFKSVAGAVGDEVTAKQEKRSFGIYMGPSTQVQDDFRYVGGDDRFQVVGGTVIAKSKDTDNGEIADAAGNIDMHRSYAVVLYDVDKMEFSVSGQSDDKWYQWKVNEGDELTASSVVAYPDADKWQSATGYFHVEPMVNDEMSVVAGNVSDAETTDEVKSPDTGDDGMLMSMTGMIGMILAGMGIVVCRRNGYR